MAIKDDINKKTKNGKQLLDSLIKLATGNSVVIEEKKIYACEAGAKKLIKTEIKETKQKPDKSALMILLKLIDPEVWNENLDDTIKNENLKAIESLIDVLKN